MNAVQEGGEKETKKTTEVEQALLKELRELKAEVVAFKERVGAPPQAQNPPSQQPTRQAPQCRTCQQSGNGWRCNHCFRSSILPSLTDALLQNSLKMVRGHAHGTGCDRA